MNASELDTYSQRCGEAQAITDNIELCKDAISRLNIACELIVTPYGVTIKSDHYDSRYTDSRFTNSSFRPLFGEMREGIKTQLIRHLELLEQRLAAI